jgi:hypothetical protein
MKSQALACMISIQIIGMILSLIWGILGFWRLGISTYRLRSEYTIQTEKEHDLQDL